MKKLTINHNAEGKGICLCENTFAKKGFEQDYAYRSFGVYLSTCLRCGRKFDEETLEIVGVRFSRDCQNELISKDELERIARQNWRYFRKYMKGITYP